MPLIRKLGSATPSSATRARGRNGASYYDASLARFTQPDTIVPGVFDPQALNRYSYVFNNPILLTDPSGHCLICIVVGAMIGAVSAWVQSGWDFEEVLTGAVIGGPSGGVGGAVGAWAGGGFVGAVAGGAAAARFLEVSGSSAF